MTASTKNFLLDLRDTAKDTADELVRKKLRDTADDIELALKKLHECATTERMQSLNGAWVRGAVWLAKAIELNNTPEGGGALTEPARLAA